MATSLKNSTLVAYPVLAMLLNFSKKYKTQLILRGHSLAGLLPVQTENVKVCVSQILGSRKSVYRYSTSQELEAEDIIQVTPGVDGKERKMRILHRSMRMFLDGLEFSSMAGLDSRTRNNVELNCFPILGSYCRDIL